MPEDIQTFEVHVRDNKEVLTIRKMGTWNIRWAAM